MQRAKKFFVLVPENLKPNFLKTTVSVKRNMDLNPFQKQFIFRTEQQAKEFYQKVGQCQSKEIFQKIEVDYKVQEDLAQYEELLQGRLSKRNHNDGVFIELEKQKTIYVIFEENQKPRVFFNSMAAKKNLNQNSQLKMFQDKQSLMIVLKEHLERLEWSIIQQQDNKNPQLSADSIQNTNPQQSDQAGYQDKLTMLDNTYKIIFEKGDIRNIKTINLNLSQQFCMKCAYFNTMHFHSAIGLSVAPYLSSQEINSQGVYIGQQKVNFLGLCALFYGVRYSAKLGLSNIVLQTSDLESFQFMKQMKQPETHRMQFILDGIKDYSQLLQKVEVELVDLQTLKVPYQKAIQAFQQFAYLKERSKKNNRNSKKISNSNEED